MATTFKTTRLDLTWSISRGQDTYGYNICRLDDCTTGKRYKCMGGGYDMIGTCLGKFLNDVYQDRLVKLAESRRKEWKPYSSTTHETLRWHVIGKLYGLVIHTDIAGKIHKVSLDGACGDSSMVHIAEAIGLEVQGTYNRRAGRTNGYIVSEPILDTQTKEIS